MEVKINGQTTSMIFEMMMMKQAGGGREAEVCRRESLVKQDGKKKNGNIWRRPRQEETAETGTR